MAKPGVDAVMIGSSRTMPAGVSRSQGNWMSQLRDDGSAPFIQNHAAATAISGAAAVNLSASAPSGALPWKRGGGGGGRRRAARGEREAALGRRRRVQEPGERAEEKEEIHQRHDQKCPSQYFCRTQFTTTAEISGC